MVERQKALVAALTGDPAVASLASFVGIDGANTSLNSGRLLVTLVPKKDRADDAATVAARLTARAATVPGIGVAMLLLTAASLVGSIWLYWLIPKGFFPEQDTGRITDHYLAKPLDIAELERLLENLATARS